MSYGVLEGNGTDLYDILYIEKYKYYSVIRGPIVV